MREIKFRAWLFGKHDNMTITVPNMEYDIIVKDGAYANVEGGWDIHGTYPTVPIMQFTGLKDKNGKEIYEGDLLKIYDNRNGYLKVEFVNAYVGGWVLTHPESVQKLSLGARAQYTIEVVGNIYENPKLLS